MQQIKSGEVHAVIFNDTYLVVFNIGVPWTSPGVTMFEELLLLRLYPERESVSYRTVVRGIEQLARANGCAGVMLGAAGAYDDRLGRVIERLGYVKAGGSYYKEL
ncbi:hypothetical protein KZJ38_07505 [Paraburkholderia edwinii]|uniref:N-acetyltransferase domain-containing protein n=1 Tax=Paraburkholderia edwinii TaxID=2861782 RepID=A0ABX8UMR7_9BURK|nr:hypothetical protein [Paraburkholderia edwinii]QYD70144.1 hypothetical protein KZJ38_07505 [Paraburkholderia edwinii]